MAAKMLHQRTKHHSWRLVLEATAGAATAGLFELAALGAHVRLGGAVGHTRGLAEVLDGLAGVLGPAEQDAAGSGGGHQGQLIEGQALTASL